MEDAINLISFINEFKWLTPTVCKSIATVFERLIYCKKFLTHFLSKKITKKWLKSQYNAVEGQESFLNLQ